MWFQTTVPSSVKPAVSTLFGEEEDDDELFGSAKPKASPVKRFFSSNNLMCDSCIHMLYNTDIGRGIRSVFNSHYVFSTFKKVSDKPSKAKHEETDKGSSTVQSVKVCE